MLKTRILTLVAFASVIAACSGGGGTPGAPPTVGPSATPTPIATATPTLAPAKSVAWTWSGALRPASAGAAVRPQTAGTPIPVQATLCDPRTTTCNRTGDTALHPFVNITETGASPAPSSPPGLSNIATTYVPAQPPFTFQIDTQAASGCANIVATFADTTTGSIPYCTYPVFTIGCVTGLSDDPSGGYSTAVSGGFNLDTKTYTSTVAGSDVYMTGQTCPGVFAAANSGPLDYQVYFPYGATAIDAGSNSLATVSPSQWKNDFTQITLNQLAGPNGTPCGSTLSCIILFKSSSGVVEEMFPIYRNASGPDPTLPNRSGDWFTAAYARDSGGTFTP